MSPPVRIASRVLIAAVLLGVTGGGCKEKITESPPPPEGPYKAATSPENVAYNLQTCYLLRDIDAYGKLLAPEFRFYFQPSAVPQDLGRPYWVHDEDSTHTAILFRTPQVNGIQIALTYKPAVVPPELDGSAAGWMKIHAQANLEVDDVNGTSYIVDGDFEDLYFRKGLLQNAGEDTASWYLVEWHDIESPGGNGVGAGPAGVEPAAVQKTSWGSIKARYN